MARAVVGGIITSTLLTLVVIPAAYSVWQEAALRRARRRMMLVPAGRPGTPR